MRNEKFEMTIYFLSYQIFRFSAIIFRHDTIQKTLCRKNNLYLHN